MHNLVRPTLANPNCVLAVSMATTDVGRRQQTKLAVEAVIGNGTALGLGRPNVLAVERIREAALVFGVDASNGGPTGDGGSLLLAGMLDHAVRGQRGARMKEGGGSNDGGRAMGLTGGCA